MSPQLGLLFSNQTPATGIGVPEEKGKKIVFAHAPALSQETSPTLHSSVKSCTEQVIAYIS